MKKLLVYAFLALAVGCGKKNSDDGANGGGGGTVASGGISVNCLITPTACNNNVYNDYGYAGFSVYPAGNGYGYQQPYYGNQQGATPYYGPQYGDRYRYRYGVYGYAQAGYGNYYGNNYYGNGYGNAYGYGQANQYGNPYYNGGTIASGGIVINGQTIPSLCNCPVGSRPVYNGTYGLGCIRNNYFNYYSQNAYYYGGDGMTNGHYTNWPQYSNINQQTQNGCYQNVAWSCMVDAAETCPTGSRCQLVYSSNRMGICVRN